MSACVCCNTIVIHDLFTSFFYVTGILVTAKWMVLYDPCRKTLLKEIDDDMLWFDLTHLLNEPQEREAPEIHITIDYAVQAFEETEKEYLELYNFFIR